jgi:hypothetical protein
MVVILKPPAPPRSHFARNCSAGSGDFTATRERENEVVQAVYNQDLGAED